MKDATRKKLKEHQYEALKKIVRNLLDGMGVRYDGWLLCCRACGQVWPDFAEMGMVQTHFQISHDTAIVLLDLVWVGEGPPPERQT